MERAYYSDTIDGFISSDPDAILGRLNQSSEGPVEPAQREAWASQIELLKPSLGGFSGKIYFEFSVPRMGSRIDVVLVIGTAVFVLEFKVGSSKHEAFALDQVWDYALDLKNFHETSHHCTVAPVLISTEALSSAFTISTTSHNDHLLHPVAVSSSQVAQVVREVLNFSETAQLNPEAWEAGRYCPTPTIIEAALALYRGHNVSEISRNDAEENLGATTDAISAVIDEMEREGGKAICFVTGVPGAGKTLVGLNIATKHLSQEKHTYSVFLSGNGPLVDILQEALARDLVAREKADGRRLTKKVARSRVKAFVQKVHHYRDDCIEDPGPPADHVALFDEAQRAWNVEKTTDFMKRKKGIANFVMSEPEFLISCIERHEDWGVIVCLVGGGQEIHTGEAGIAEWLDALNRKYPDWQIYISSRLTDSEYAAGKALAKVEQHGKVSYRDDLHLSVSMRSFRAENVSHLVKCLLDMDVEEAKENLQKLKDKYPIVITRDVSKAKSWLKAQARGSERYGMVVSSQAERLRPHAIHVKSPMNPVHWFLDGKEDVRSSYYLEDVATEFSIQGLELDWVSVAWDGDFRYRPDGWQHKSFKGSKWQNINKPERQMYLKNAYRVLLTRARQGMVIVVPEGSEDDPTRAPKFYDPTYAYLRGIGFAEL